MMKAGSTMQAERAQTGEEAWRRWTRGSSPLKGPLLALLAESPGYPSQLAGRLHGRVGPAWGVDPGDAYPILKRFKALGLASSERRPDSEKPHQMVIEYRATSTASRAVEEWMAGPLEEEPIREELWTRIAVSRPAHAPYLLRALDEYERARLDLLEAQERKGPVRGWTDLEIELVRKGVSLKIAADLTWIDLARGSIEESGDFRDAADLGRHQGTWSGKERWRKWMHGSSALKGPLLAVLAESPGYPYQLAGQVSQRVGPAWQVNANDAYALLRRFEELGLASSERRPGPIGVRDRREAHQMVIEYRATDLTDRAVVQWMASRLAPKPIREELWTRIAVSKPSHSPYLLCTLDQYEQSRLNLLEAHLERPVCGWPSVVMMLAREGVALRIAADLEWVDVARGAIEEFSTALGEPGMNDAAAQL